MKVDLAEKQPEKTNKELIGELIGELVGEESVCWADGFIPTGVFDSERASKIVDKLEALLTKEKERLLILLLKEAPYAVERYRAHIKQTSSLVNASMAVAYDRGMRDAIKILTQEGKI